MQEKTSKDFRNAVSVYSTTNEEARQNKRDFLSFLNKIAYFHLFFSIWTQVRLGNISKVHLYSKFSYVACVSLFSRLDTIINTIE